jgi:regulator of RNase E activity RraA
VAVVSWHVHTLLERFAAAPSTAGAAVASEPIGPKQQVSVRGLVIDAGARDVAALEKIGFPIWSRALSAKGTVQSTLGCVNIPLVCGESGGSRPGDIIVADDDGVVVVPAADIADTLAAAEKRQASEEGKRGNWHPVCWDWTFMKCAQRFKRLNYAMSET